MAGERKDLLCVQNKWQSIVVGGSLLVKIPPCGFDWETALLGAFLECHSRVSTTSTCGQSMLLIPSVLLAEMVAAGVACSEVRNLNITEVIHSIHVVGKVTYQFS